MPENVVSSVADGTDASRRQRDQIAGILQAYARAKASGVSQRDFAASQGIAHSSLQHWLARQSSIAAPPEAIAFFEGPVGVACLHQISDSSPRGDEPNGSLRGERHLSIFALERAECVCGEFLR